MFVLERCKFFVFKIERSLRLINIFEDVNGL